jgi:DNA-binding transcriptional ArsR family regulator
MPGRAAAMTSAIGDPLRLRLLQELMAGPAAVSELVRRSKARQANVSNHLAVLRAAGLVVARRRGRLIEYALAGSSVAQLVEAVSALAGPPPAARRAELAEARMCYDHLAGRLGVAIFDRLRTSGAFVDGHRSDGALRLGTRAGDAFARLGVELDRLPPSRRRLAFRCLDWTERRPHLGGQLGSAVAEAFERQGWTRRHPVSRRIDAAPRAWRAITPRGA